MRLVLAIALLLAVPATASAAKVDLLVVGKSDVLRGPSKVRLKERKVQVGGKRCSVGSATPLSVLAATGLELGLRDYGSCGSRAADAGGLYVTSVAGRREKGRGGWVYKVGRRAGTASAADPSGSFGDGRKLRGGQRVTWFWCEQNASGSCQRTLEAVPDRTTVARGGTLRVTVRGYDDFGKGRTVSGARVTLGGASAVSGTGGVAVLAAPSSSGTLRLGASKAGLVRAFPRKVRVS